MRGAGLIASASSVMALLGSAPMQCGQGSTADLRVEDDAPEALWLLANRFETEGKHDAAVETWGTLADRYPSNRHAAESARLSGHVASRSGAVDGG